LAGWGCPGEGQIHPASAGPKQALTSSSPARDLDHGTRSDHPFVFIRAFANYQCRSTDVGEVLHGHTPPPGFGGQNLPLPRATKRAFASLGPNMREPIRGGSLILLFTSFPSFDIRIPDPDETWCREKGRSFPGKPEVRRKEAERIPAGNSWGSSFHLFNFP
jgi:hypothetical protein